MTEMGRDAAIPCAEVEVGFESKAQIGKDCLISAPRPISGIVIGPETTIPGVLQGRCLQRPEIPNEPSATV